MSRVWRHSFVKNPEIRFRVVSKNIARRFFEICRRLAGCFSTSRPLSSGNDRWDRIGYFLREQAVVSRSLFADEQNEATGASGSGRVHDEKETGGCCTGQETRSSQDCGEQNRIHRVCEVSALGSGVVARYVCVYVCVCVLGWDGHALDVGASIAALFMRGERANARTSVSERRPLPPSAG